MITATLAGFLWICGILVWGFNHVASQRSKAVGNIAFWIMFSAAILTAFIVLTLLGFKI